MVKHLLVVMVCVMPALAQDDGMDDVRKLIDDGFDLYKRGKFVEALDKFETALQKKPSASLVYTAIRRVGEDWAIRMLNTTEKDLEGLEGDPKGRVDLSRRIHEMGRRLYLHSAPRTEWMKIEKSQIMKVVQMMKEDKPAYNEAMFHLLNAGPYAIKYLIPFIGDNDQVIRSRVFNAISQIGPPVTMALAEALNSKNDTIRQNAATLLGVIGDERAVPALKRVYDDANEKPEVKREASAALGKILKAPKEQWIAAHDYYYNLGKGCFYSNPALVPGWERHYLFWKWDAEKDVLTERDVPSFAYNEQLAEEAFFDSLDLQPNNEMAWSMLLMTLLTQYIEAVYGLKGADNELAIAEPSEKPRVEEEVKWLKDKFQNIERARVVAAIGGRKAAYRALNQLVSDKNYEAAYWCLKLIEKVGHPDDFPPTEALVETQAAGGLTLSEAIREKYPAWSVIESLAAEDKRVRFGAAEALMKLCPRDKKVGWGLVIPDLVEALGTQGARTVLVIYDVTTQQDYERVNQLRKTLLLIGAYPVIAKSPLEGLIKTRDFPSYDLIIIQNKIAGTLWSVVEFFSGKKPEEVTVFDALRDDVRTKNTPKFIVCDSQEEYDKAKEGPYKPHTEYYVKYDTDKMDLQKYIEDTFNFENAKLSAKTRADQFSKDAAEALAQLDVDVTCYPFRDAVPALSASCHPGGAEVVRREDFIRLPSIVALGNIGDARAIDTLLKVLDDKPADEEKVKQLKTLREASGKSLAKIFLKNAYTPKPDEMEILKKHLYDGDLDVEIAVAEAVGNAVLTSDQRRDVAKHRRLVRKTYTADDIGQ